MADALHRKDMIAQSKFRQIFFHFAMTNHSLDILYISNIRDSIQQVFQCEQQITDPKPIQANIIYKM
jgi:hypothetical protein